ncbi:MAG: ABC transporter permease [Synergistaceae bacterium]|jgi:peptide/nickel transport system permease protein|nr:ABC transporter permease [Synergistaceae bacterium]
MELCAEDIKKTSLSKEGIREYRLLLLRNFLSHRFAVAGLVIVAVMVVSAVLAPVIASGGPYVMNVAQRLKPPTPDHIFGTDNFGRDLFSRVVYGLRTSLAVGFSIAFLSALFGTIIGLMAAYFPIVDLVVMRVLEGMMAIPSTLMAIAMMSALGANVVNVIVSLTIVYVPSIAKIARASALSVKEMTYIEAIRAQGARWNRIVFVHIAPNIVSPVIVQTTFIFASAILVESSLSFLGVGIPAPAPSLGNILSEAKNVIFNSWWMSICPGTVMLFSVLGINILGDGIRDILDPLSK